jgi:hypothetical protein
MVAEFKIYLISPGYEIHEDSIKKNSALCSEETVNCLLSYKFPRKTFKRC